MIDDMALAWELFGDSWVSGWLIAILLAVTGVYVVARDQIFLGVSLSQASTLGIAVSLAIGACSGHSDSEVSELIPAALAVTFSVLAALITARGGTEGKESREAITGWVFLFSASVSILVAALSPLELEEIHQLILSNIIAATMADVVVFTALVLGTAVFVIAFHRRILLLTIDPVMASAVGMNVRLWTIGIYVWLGLAVGLSLRVSGLLYTFGCLVLPALTAKNLTREVRPMFIVAPAIAAVTTAVGFALAHHFDVPHAQVAVALQSSVLVAAWAKKATSTQ